MTGLTQPEFYEDDFSNADDDDVRFQELESLKAIYDELEVDFTNYSGKLHISVRPSFPACIRVMGNDFKTNSNDNHTHRDNHTAALEKHENHYNIPLTYFPHLIFKFQLGKKYPHEEAPLIELSSKFDWVWSSKISELKQKIKAIYEDYQDVCIYSMIDLLNDEASNFFQIGEETSSSSSSSSSSSPVPIVVTRELSVKMMKFNQEALLQQFFNETYECEICQDVRKGSDCVKVPSCGHVFCRGCFKDYIVSQVNNNQVSTCCPNYECVKNYDKKQAILKKYSAGDVYLNNRNITISELREIKRLVLRPQFSDEFIEMSLENDVEMFNKYKELFHARKIERYEHYFPGQTSKCPSLSCSKHFVVDESKQISGEAENINDFDEEDCYNFETEGIKKWLMICPYCRFAYCSQCRHSWHGRINACSYVATEILNKVVEQYLDAAVDSPVRTNLAIYYGRAAMRKAVSQYLADKEFEKFLEEVGGDLVKCPGCAAVIEKIDGCNKMDCLKCATRFCNICGDMLYTQNPYDHFNDQLSPCYGKLFEGMVPEDAALLM